MKSVRKLRLPLIKSWVSIYSNLGLNVIIWKLVQWVVKQADNGCRFERGERGRGVWRDPRGKREAKLSFHWAGLFLWKAVVEFEIQSHLFWKIEAEEDPKKLLSIQVQLMYLLFSFPLTFLSPFPSYPFSSLVYLPPLDILPFLFTGTLSRSLRKRLSNHSSSLLFRWLFQNLFLLRNFRILIETKQSNPRLWRGLRWFNALCSTWNRQTSKSRRFEFDCNHGGE